LLHAQQRKDKGFLYLDTHAGSGCYERGPEAQAGVARLCAATVTMPELTDYCRAVGGGPDYPGSPLLAAALLRPQDRAVFLELLPPEQRALQRALQAAGAARVRVECADGWQHWTAFLPPAERRALVLIDPPFEDSAADLSQLLDTVIGMLARLASAVICCWYPIKRAEDLQAWKQRVRGVLKRPCLCSELWLHRTDSRVALNGSGLLLVNPPYQFAERAELWLPELEQLLAPAGEPGYAAGHRVEWLVQ
jgi:23S rRNA (adenine2030-N6)-methyltransferase